MKSEFCNKFLNECGMYYMFIVCAMHEPVTKLLFSDRFSSIKLYFSVTFRVAQLLQQKLNS
jgi:hypothetical protein